MASASVLVTILGLVSFLDTGTVFAELFHPEYIIGGNTTDIKQHPYQVAIWSNGEFRGSGAVVGRGWVITTASIIVGFDTSSLRVRAHSSLASSGGALYNVSTMIVHPKFSFTNMTYDVALLKLKRPFLINLSSRNSMVIPKDIISLARRPLPPNTSPLLSGWGSTEKQEKMGDHLLQATMIPVNISSCQEGYNRRLYYTQFCAVPEDVYGPCWGDSGDLLVFEGKLYGLLSWNKGCYDEIAPSVFMDIRSVYKWVLRKIKRTSHQKMTSSKYS